MTHHTAPPETPTQDERAAQAHTIIDRISYMVLGTADADGRPWASPVYFATDGHGAFYWVSSHEARHSANIATRPEVGIVIFDSTVPIGTGQGVYVEARAEQLAGPELGRGLAVFSERSVTDGGRPWTRDDVEGETLIRMYRATAESYSMLAKDGQPDHRVPFELGGL
jgi:nitroimidazol reductase NimA-like FMN-containing flavoprotein (pyridoxamine 5'-phosphate oxidase superfamily)